MLLGIVTTEGELRFQVADQAVFRGHLEWIERESISRAKVKCGFSILVRDGQVDALFPMSALNPAPQHSLNDQEIDQIRALLPLSGVSMIRSLGDATRVLRSGGSLPDLAEAIGVIISSTESTVDDIRQGLQYPGFVAEQAALALLRREKALTCTRRAGTTKRLVKD